MPTFGSLFAGIGGIDLGLERAGWECRWQVEWDEWCQRVLAKHWPDVPRYGDITRVDWSAVERVDLLAGGFPCQPFSMAGKRRGTSDDRWLWPEFARAIRALRPRYVLVENVPGFLAGHGGMGAVLGDLADLGYDARWDCIPAAAVGAPHLRYRVWIVGAMADTDAERLEERGLHEQRWAEVSDPAGSRWCDSPLADADGTPADAFTSGPGSRGAVSEPGRWLIEPDVGRVAHGVPSRVDRLRGLGNAVVPQVAAVIGRRLLEVMA